MPPKHNQINQMYDDDDDKGNEMIYAVNQEKMKLACESGYFSRICIEGYYGLRGVVDGP